MTAHETNLHDYLSPTVEWENIFLPGGTIHQTASKSSVAKFNIYPLSGHKSYESSSRIIRAIGPHYLHEYWDRWFFETSDMNIGRLDTSIKYPLDRRWPRFEARIHFFFSAHPFFLITFPREIDFQGEPLITVDGKKTKRVFVLYYFRFEYIIFPGGAITSTKLIQLYIEKVSKKRL